MIVDLMGCCWEFPVVLPVAYVAKSTPGTVVIEIHRTILSNRVGLPWIDQHLHQSPGDPVGSSWYHKSRPSPRSFWWFFADRACCPETSCWTPFNLS